MKCAHHSFGVCNSLPLQSDPRPMCFSAKNEQFLEFRGAAAEEIRVFVLDVRDALFFRKADLMFYYYYY